MVDSYEMLRDLHWIIRYCEIHCFVRSEFCVQQVDILISKNQALQMLYLNPLTRKRQKTGSDVHASL